MATLAIKRKSRLQGTLRLDAEFYQPKYEQNRQVIQRFDCIALGELCSTVKKGIFDIKASSYTSQGVPFIRISDLKWGLIDDSNLARIPQTLHKKHLASALEKGDIVLSKTAYPAAALMTLNECNVSQDIIAVKLSKAWRDKFTTSYIVAFLNSHYGRLLLEQWFQGNVQMHLALPDAKRVWIPHFPMNFQLAVEKTWQRAAALLTASKELYARAERLLVDELGLQDWKSPHTLTFVGAYGRTVRSRRLDAEHFQPRFAELRKRIRNYWNGFCCLLDIAMFSDETIDPHQSPEQEFDYIELADINQSIGAIESTNRILGKDAPSRARMFLRKGDVILSSVEGSLDKVALVSEEFHGAIGSTGFFVLRPRTVQSEYLLALAKSMLVREQMSCEASGTILSAISAASLRNIIIPNIPHEKRSEIAELVAQSHAVRREAKAILKKAIRAVEIVIEEGQEEALTSLK